ncbi:MAG: GNAT family N-acetyltransferase [Sulfuriferula multivorans]|uniref:GNAT family N-acetyltransferase n=1 Tax=Sulfuriferula multivorans TaxID=1559896 RepID=A0A7C9TBG0_9PROT|nr:GNAT family N-acetyltransferase [Sulfuriferula multivorans]
MTALANSFEILSRFELTRSFLDHVRSAADAHRDALGFLPASVYVEFSRNDCLYVLVENTPKGQQYAGHLLFTQRYPSARIVQMFTAPQYRRKSLAVRLLDHFRNNLTDAGFTSIYASVAEDLVEANAFWAKQQFHIQCIKKGGETRKRRILRRCHELDSPQLIPLSGLNKYNPLGLPAPLTTSDSFFLLDLNVLFDLTGPRRIRHKEAVSLFQAERMDLCKLAISNEIREELHRTATPGKLDPMEGFVDILPSVPIKAFDQNDALFKDLALTVFPLKTELTKNDKSDLCHIATAIQYSLAGLITNDGAVLEAGPEIRAKHGIEILSPAAFTLESLVYQDSAFEGTGSTELTLCMVDDEDAVEIHAFLSKQGVSTSRVASEWLPTGASSHIASRFGVWANDALVGYVTWSAAAKSATIVARIAVEASSAASADAARIMLTFLLEQLPKQGPKRINLEIPRLQPVAREVAIKLGFRGAPDQIGLYKIVLGAVLTNQSWVKFQELLQLNNQIKLPDSIPDFQHPDQQIPIIGPDGNRRYVTLDELESLLAPALLCLPGRPELPPVFRLPTGGVHATCFSIC